MPVYSGAPNTVTPNSGATNSEETSSGKLNVALTAVANNQQPDRNNNIYAILNQYVPAVAATNNEAEFNKQIDPQKTIEPVSMATSPIESTQTDRTHSVERMQSPLQGTVSNFFAPVDRQQYNPSTSENTASWYQASVKYPEPRDFGLNYLMDKKKQNLLKEVNRLHWRDKSPTVPKSRAVITKFMWEHPKSSLVTEGGFIKCAILCIFCFGVLG